MARILLLGGSGFIGANLAADLVAHNHEVSTLSPHGRSALPAVTAYQASIADLDTVKTIIGAKRPDVVVHLASGLIPSSSTESWATEVNMVSTPSKQLALFLAEAGIKLVYVSSGGAVYGTSQKDRMHESDRCKPISLYGQEKVEIESFVRFAHRTRGLRYLIVRPSNPFGPRQNLVGPQGLVSVIFGKLKSGEPLDVWGDGSALRNYIFIDDLVHSLRLLLEGNVEAETLNIGSGVGHSLLDVVATVEAVTAYKVEMRFHPARAADVPSVVLDVGKLQTLGAWRTRTLAEGVATYAQALGVARA